MAPTKFNFEEYDLDYAYLKYLLRTKDISRRQYSKELQKLKDQNTARLAKKESLLQKIETRFGKRIGFKISTNSLHKRDITDSELLELIAKATSNGMWRLSFGSTVYTLNDTTRQRLANLVKNDLINYSDTTKSDEDVVLAIKSGKSISIQPLEPKHKNKKSNGAFFKYNNATNIDLNRYGIFTSNEPTNYDDTCLVLALKNGGLSFEKQNMIKNMIKNRIIPKKDLQTIADTLKICIKLKTDDTKHNYLNVYGKEYKDEIYNIGLLDEHYFIIEPTQYTSYSIKHYNDVKDIYDFNHIFRMKGKYYERDSKRCIDSFDLVKHLLENKESLLKPISLEDKFIASTQFYDKVSDEITNLCYNEDTCIRPINPKEKHSENFHNLFFDFETNPNGRHTPYLCRTFDGSVASEFVGENCGLKMLYSLKRNTRLIAHNCTYDFRFIIQYLRNVKELARGNRLISASGNFLEYKVEIKDSYHLISMPLRAFPKVFGLAGEKEVMPYTLYTAVNVEKQYVPISEALAILPAEEHEQFKLNIKRWNLQKEECYDIIKYSSEYCKIDCEILYHGYNTFRGWIRDSFKLDIDTILTCASLAHQYFVNKGCYEGVNELGGIPQMFIQGCVVGGRVMCSENKKIKITEVVNDFDAVSLYPSAMARMPGFLRGKPKVINNLNYDWISKQDGYFIDIEIESVGIHRKFPLMSYKNEESVRTFSNEMVGRIIRVDKTTLEDLIEFQGITFKVLRGYYFDEGYNTKIRGVINYIFNKRLEEKKNKNPVEIVYKLLMNSGYGKTIMKPVETESRFFDTYKGEKEFEVYLSRNYNWITSFIRFGNKIKVNTVKTLNEHFNIAQVGTSILAMSKRIMNEVMSTAEDNKIDIYYQDTDSMHLKDKDISLLSDKFKAKYGRELIGKNLGQFHSDFSLDGCKDIVAVESIFLGKKSYIDKLEGTNEAGEKVQGYHIRMKGIPEKCIEYVVQNSEQYKDVFELYLDLYNGSTVHFDLTNGGNKANFKFNKDYTIDTLSIFTRSVKF